MSKYNLDTITKYDILNANFGLEREMLRVTEDGELSKKPHPAAFGNKSSNPYITTDFSESQVEIITPVLNSVEQVYDYANVLYDIVNNELKDEYLWPQSMPCSIKDEKDIPVAVYDQINKESQEYRERLLTKYGAKKQLISGIHFNFSFKDETLKKIYENSNTSEEFYQFKNHIYLKITRNFIRYNWLLVYLLGGTATIHKSYLTDCCKDHLKELTNDSYFDKGVVSIRNSECGYKNKVDLYPNYNSVEEYKNSIDSFIKDKLISKPKELYSSVRIKTLLSKESLEPLITNGIDYLEFRSIDINPFERAGISLNDLRFINLFIVYLLFKEETDYKEYQEEALENQHLIAKFGQHNIKLKKDGVEIDKKEYALSIIYEMEQLNDRFNLGLNESLNIAKDKINDSEKTNAFILADMVSKNGYINTHMDLAKKYKKQSFDCRYKFQGYENMELSTQILMKEAIKKGIKVNVVDSKDNFIKLSKDDHIEYIKQATKTSADNYVSVLVMENKLVTKKVLAEHDIKVPNGDEYDNLDVAIFNINKYIDKPIVVKPKSTNFGKGITIFKDGASYDDILKAIKFAFEFDNLILIEEFIKGKEYRFLVIDDEVAAILHRVPANVVGNSKNTIKELVEEKNKDSLRGVGYKTPLEKIKLDQSVNLFLKQYNMDVNSIPSEGQIIYLRENSNISTGGDSIDYTDEIFDKFKKIAVDAAKAANAKICGVDMMIEDYKDPNSNYAIIELNFNPAIHIHSYPYIGTERNIAIKILKLLKFV